MHKKVVITGAGGYIGSVASSLFLEAGYEVVGVDNLIRGFKGPMVYLQTKYPSKYKYYLVDIATDMDSVLSKENNIDGVVHFAAFCNVGESEKEPQLYFGNNTKITIGLLESLRKHNISSILFSSTCALYGEPVQNFIDESHPITPTAHPYGESKFMCERIIDWYSKILGFHYIFLRYFNVCGAADAGEIGDSKKPSFHLMQNAVRGALGIDTFYLNNTPVDTPDKTPIRDYINVVDLGLAHVKAFEYLISQRKNDIFNLGTGTGNSVLEIIKKVEEVTGVKLEMNEGERRKTDVSRAVASNKKITETLNWSPTHSIEDSVNSLVSWYKKYPHGWEE